VKPIKVCLIKWKLLTKIMVSTNKLEAIGSTQEVPKIEIFKFDKKNAFTSCSDLFILDSFPCKQVCVENVIARGNEKLKQEKWLSSLRSRSR
jgi:Fe-S-cluster-containing hydrogenase component 2